MNHVETLESRLLLSGPGGPGGGTTNSHNLSIWSTTSASDYTAINGDATEVDDPNRYFWIERSFNSLDPVLRYPEVTFNLDVMIPTGYAPATEGTDFSTLTRQVTIQQGVPRVQFATLQVIDDEDAEPVETFDYKVVSSSVPAFGQATTRATTQDNVNVKEIKVRVI